MTQLQPLTSLRQDLAVLERRYRVARDRGVPTAELLATIDIVRTQIEAIEGLLQQAEAGYRPIAV